MPKYVFVLILFALLSPVRAQEDDTLPVLQPEEVLADSVEVIETLPEVNYDALENLLYYLPPDSQAWEAVAAPDELLEHPDYVGTDRLPSGSFEIAILPSEMAGSCPLPTTSFAFDPATRAFTRHEPDPDAVDLNRYWAVDYPVATEDVRLINYCDSALVGAALPADISDRVRSNTQIDVPFPTQMYTPEYIILAVPPPDDNGEYLFTVYTIAEDSWSESFPFPYSGSWGITDVAFENGELYFVAIGDTGSDYHMLDIATRTFTELFATPYPQAVYRNQGDVMHYIGYDDTHYQFYAYDLSAQRGEVLAEIPCADLTGGCIQLSIRDGNSLMDTASLMFILRERNTNAASQADVRYFVVDTAESRLLYQQPFPSSNLITFAWIDQDEPGLLIDVYQDIAEAYGLFVDLNSDDPAGTQVIVPYQIGAVSPDQRSVIVYTINETNRARTIGLVDLETLAYRPVTLPVANGVLDVRVYWRADSTLEVTVRSPAHDFNRFPQPVTLRTWIIQP